MIVDIHTHIFPPRLIAERDRLAVADPVFGEMYGNPSAKMATAEDLLASMDAARIDVAVACGFWWRDPATAAEHADYLVESAHAAGGRIVPFVPTFEAIPGARGIGEIRLDDPDRVPPGDAPLLLHCSEPFGHAYPGKTGGLGPGGLARLLDLQPARPVIAAHWGGGFPFAGLMPEVRETLDRGHVLFDTAASAFLYRPDVFRAAVDLVGPRAIAWGSDFPLRAQARDLAEARDALPPAARDAALGGNAARLLGLE